MSADRLKGMVVRMAGEYPDSPLVKSGLESITIQSVFAASAEGDPLGRELSACTARFFATALRNLTLMFNPEEVVFQGDYAHIDEHFRETLFDELRAFRYYGDSQRPFELVVDKRSILELTTLGAYTLLIDRLFSDEMI